VPVRSAGNWRNTENDSGGGENEDWRRRSIVDARGGGGKIEDIWPTYCWYSSSELNS